MNAALVQLISRWKDDTGGTYRSWFLWERRTKTFRSIRAGIAEDVREIDAGTLTTTREKVAKRYLIHAAGFNLGLIMRKLTGFGTPRGWADALRAFLARCAGCAARAKRQILYWFSRRLTPRSLHPRATAT